MSPAAPLPPVRVAPCRDTVLLAGGPAAAEMLAARPPITLWPRRRWVRAVVFVAARDDLTLADIASLTNAARRAADTVVIATDIGPRDRKGQGADPALQIARTAGATVITPRGAQALSDVAAFFRDLETLDGPVGFDPSDLPWEHPSLCPLAYLAVGPLHAPPDPLSNTTWRLTLLRLNPDRALCTYNALYETHSRSLCDHAGYSLAVKLRANGEPESATTLTFVEDPAAP